MLNIYTNFCYLRRHFCFFILSPTTQPSSSFFSFFLFSFLVSCLFFYSLNSLTIHDWRKLYNGRDVGICRYPSGAVSGHLLRKMATRYNGGGTREYILCQNFSVDGLSGPASNFPETSESRSAARSDPDDA